MPSRAQHSENKLFSISMGSEILNPLMAEASSAFSINKIFSNNTELSLSWTQLNTLSNNATALRTATASEIGFHFQRKIYEYGHFDVMAGIQDILIKSGERVVHLDNISPFILFSSNQQYDDYNLILQFGIGSGKIGYDSQRNVLVKKASPMGGMVLYLPYFIENGGARFMVEYIGSALNLGFSVPFSPQYQFHFGITNFPYLSESNLLISDESEAKVVAANSSALSLGLTIDIPRLSTANNNNNPILTNNAPPLLGEATNQPSEVETNKKILHYQDTIKICIQEIRNLSSENQLLQQELSLLVDSTRTMFLTTQIERSAQNRILRHLTRTLRFYYNDQLREALNEVEKAIDLNPNLALSYARKGSIYYKMGDIERATMNWNIALKLDPEFEEIQAMLNATKNQQLESVQVN
ncbi:MAG: hypothetical protein CBD58_02620 [bacterium TMED198]|nr:MAG: hypothetical protein CBD58_02620 [bacterium TMED198]